MRWLATLALAACAVPKKTSLPPDFDFEPTALVSRVEGVITDRATGKPLPDAEVRLEDSWDYVYITDDNGGYVISRFAGSTTTAAVIYNGGWMFEPLVVAKNGVTRHDFMFAPDPGCARRDDVDVDRVFKVALVNTFADRRHLRIVDDRARSRGNSVSMGGIDLTTRDLLQNESDRSHKAIDYVYINAELLTGCTARVTIGSSCVIPHEGVTECNEDRWWLYVKDASGWHRLALIGGGAS
ncbi:MAG TPA: hypothetical protein VGG74_28410 [Kofleriaceae bacterium]